MPPSAPTATDTDAMVLGALLIGVPTLFGWIVGWAMRPVLQPLSSPWRWFVAILVALVPLALALPVASAIPAIGSWDVLMVFGWIALSMTLSATHDPATHSSAAMVVIPLLTLLMLEGTARWALPTPTTIYPPAREARLVVSFSVRDPPCDAIFPETTGFIEGRSLDAGDGIVKVVHVGDSMVWGNGVSREEGFVSLLGGLQPGVAHINSGTPAAGLEGHLLVAGHWIEQSRPDLVVVYAFIGNDLHDIDRAYPCCGMGPLMDWQGPQPTPRCDRLEWTFPTGVLLSGSPPPYPLRVATGWSAFAAHATMGFDNINRWILARQLFNVNFAATKDLPMEERLAKVDRILTALRDRFAKDGIPLVLVVLPYRETLARAQGLEPAANDVWGTLENGRAGHNRVVDTAHGLGIDVLDSWPLLAAAIERDGVDKWFARDYPGDVHFSAEGHALLAEWLAPQLAQRGAMVTAKP